MTDAEPVATRPRLRAMRVARALLALFLVAGLHLAAAMPASACSCFPAAERDDFGRASAIFVGDITAYTPPVPLLGTSNVAAVWTFRVAEVYKGEVAAIQDVASPVSGASCGWELPPGGRFLVYASSDSGSVASPVPGVVLYAHLCGGTRAISEGPVPAAFGAPTVPLPGARTAEVSPPPSASPDSAAGASPASGVDWATVATGTTGGVSLAILGLVLARRSTRRTERT